MSVHSPSGLPTGEEASADEFVFDLIFEGCVAATRKFFETLRYPCKIPLTWNFLKESIQGWFSRSRSRRAWSPLMTGSRMRYCPNPARSQCKDVLPVPDPQQTA